MTLAALRPQPAQSIEYALLDYAARLERNLTGRVAVHVHLSRLSGSRRRDKHVDAAINHFQKLVSGFDGQLFQTAGGDIVFVCDDARISMLNDAVLRLRHLFSDDPLTRLPDDDPEGGFCTWYFLDRDYPQFVALARRLFDLSEARRNESRKLQDRTAPQGGRPLTPHQLAKLEDALANTDLSVIVRNQPVCAVTPDAPPEIVFHEIYVSIEDLGRTLLPGVSIASDPWLFQRLTRTLDTRVLRQATHDYARTDRRFSLNLNIATVLSPEFRRFEEAVGDGVRGRLVIEFQYVDIFSDMPAFLFAREYLRERGFRICIDGLTHLTLPFVDREKLGLDLLKMRWSDDLLYGVGEEGIEALEQSVRAAGITRVIMCRCESEAALSLGGRMGISLFQGRHIDALLARER